MKQDKLLAGHITTLFTILIWGTTFISTKILLTGFSPVEILFDRFLLGLLALTLAYPHRLKGTNRKQELVFAGAGLCGITLYYLLENIALTYTMASNVGVIVSVAPFFTAILAHLFLKGEKLNAHFIGGFAAAMVGICVMTYGGSTEFHLKPMGDLLAVLASMVWAVYSILTRKISAYGYPTIQTTRRIFIYGILFMLPVVFFSDLHLGLARFSNPIYLFNILYLGIGACAVCFVTWNTAIRLLGAVKTSIYIYLIPVVTIITSVLVLHEQMTWLTGLGTVLALSGLVISESKSWRREKVGTEAETEEAAGVGE